MATHTILLPKTVLLLDRDSRWVEPRTCDGVGGCRIIVARNGRTNSIKITLNMTHLF